MRRISLLIFHHGTKFCAKKLIDAVRHLGIVASSYRTTHEVYSLGHIIMSNFMQIRCIVLKVW